MNKPEKRRGFGISMLLLSGMFWASITILSKIGIESGLDALSLNLGRMVIGAIFLFLFTLVFRTSAFKIRLKKLLFLLILGVFDYALGGILFLGSLHYIDASLSFLVLYAYPAMVVIFSAIAGREKFKLTRLGAVILTIIGVAFVLEAGMAIQGEEWIGIAMVLSAAAVFSIYLIIVEIMMDQNRPTTITFYSILGGALGMVLLSFFIPMNVDKALEPTNLIILLVVSIGGTALSMITFLLGVRHVGATNAAVITTLEPVVVVIIAGVFLNEQLSAWQYFGIVLQLAGVLWVNLEPHKISEPGPG